MWGGGGGGGHAFQNFSKFAQMSNLCTSNLFTGRFFDECFGFKKKTQTYA